MILARLAHPFLRRLEPETAHRLTIEGLKHIPLAAAPDDDPRLAVEVLGLRFPNPLGIAAGFDKDAEVPDALLRLGFGFAEVGTLTPLPQPGNPRPRVFRLTADGALINRYGFNNHGHAAALSRLAARRHPQGIVGVNIGANKDSVDRAADYVRGITTFAEVADYFTVNISSPNTPGLRDLQAARALDDLLARVLDARDAAPHRVPVLLKIAPDLDEASLDDIVGTARRRQLDGMIVSNTTIARPADMTPNASAEEAGGLSGRPLFEPSTRILARCFVRLDGQFPLIGVGGITDGESALRKIRAGASLIQVYTALALNGPGLIRAIKRDLLSSLALNGVGLADLVGKDADVLARD